ncbi:MAG TPA: choice-of-anchor Q domain-containing protein [Gammaproteobacteria bacterium]|nr:choice-of-anchor Q domain-containing protein [Gammaproteobacteria bacterium]
MFGHSDNAGMAGFRSGATDSVPIPSLSKTFNTTLANHGGLTRTHALVTGRLAINAPSDGTCPPPAKDQRGVSRPQDGNGDGGPACDIGSFERQ